MMHNAYSERLNNAADILEKVAAYVDSIESNEIKEQKQKFAEEVINPVTEKLAGLLDGEKIPESLSEKLSSADPEILDVLNKLATKREDSDSLGGPGDYKGQKVAEYASDEDDAILQFCMS